MRRAGDDASVVVGMGAHTPADRWTVLEAKVDVLDEKVDALDEKVTVLDEKVTVTRWEGHLTR